MTQKQRARLGSLAFYLGNTLVALIFVSPLIWMVSSSLKPESGIFKGLNSLSTFIPQGASLNNYQEVFQRINMWKFIGNYHTGFVYQFDLRLCAGQIRI